MAAAVGLLTLAAAFVTPYAELADAPAPPVGQLLGRLDGGGQLVKEQRADGTIAWVSSTSRVLPDALLGELPEDLADAILSRVGPRGTATYEATGRIPGTDLVRTEVQERQEGGTSASRASITVLDDGGWALAGSLWPDGSVDAFDPPLLLLPSDPVEGTSWSSEGTVGAARYRYRAEVVEVGRHDTPLAGERRCALVSGRLVVESGDADPYEQSGEERYCEGLGSVSFEQEEPDGTRTGQLVASNGHAPLELPPVAAVPDEVERPRLEDEPWVRTSVVSPLAGVVTPRPSLLPTVVHGRDPLLLVGTEATPALQAVRTVADDGGVRAWTAATGSVSYGAPLVDGAGDRIYLGTAHGEVRAMTVDGLFLWATDVGDNVAIRPALVDGVLVVGSEGGDVVGMDPRDGAELWRAPTGGPVTSWPVGGDGHVVIGSDDGVVRAVQVDDGEVLWTYEAAAAVEAPIVAVDDGWLVADRSGQLTRLDDEGTERWATSVGLVLRTAPLAVDDLVVAVAGEVVGLDLDDGSVRWRRAGDHAGPAAAIDGRAAVVVAETGGALVALDELGELVERWEAPTSVGGAGSSTRVGVGPVAGAGAVWLVNQSGSVQRLGPALTGAAEARAVRWATSVMTAPFEGSLLRTTPLVDGNDLYLVDGNGGLYRLDVAGALQRTGAIGLTGDFSVSIGGVADAGIGYLAAQGTVGAFALPDGAVRWQVEVPGSTLRPPALHDQTLLVVSEVDGQHHVTALDRATGATRWQADTGTAVVQGATPSSLLVVDDLVLTGDPLVARRIVDGTVVWTSDVTGLLGGAGGLPSGDLVVATTDAADPTASPRTDVVTVDPTSGAELARAQVDGVLAEGLFDLLVADGLVILQDGARRRILGVDPTGEIGGWDTTLPGSRLGGAALLEDGLLWVGLVDGRVLALDPATGAIVVRTPDLGLDLGDGSLAQLPVLRDGVVVLAGGLLALGIEGEGSG